MSASEDVKPTNESLVAGNNLLAISLHQVLAQNEQNIFFSPFSLASAFAMLLFGARGSTASEIRQAVEFDNIDNDTLKNMFQKFISSLEKFPESYTISFANSLAVHKDFDVNEQYLSDLSDYFKAQHFLVDFVNESAVAVGQINDWVNEKTCGMIPKLLNSLDTNTVMVILNAVYFKGFWLKQFEEKSTFMQYFYNEGIEDNAKLVEMMHLKYSFLSVEKESFKVLQLPYKGDEMAMLIFLPNSRDGLKEMEDQLTSNIIPEIKKEMAKRKVEVALPKFRLEYSKDLKESFQELGIKEIFECGADFGGISNCKNLAVSEVVHKAVLEVNEEGCEAAAATAAVMKNRAMVFTPEFIVDHPFLFMIYNTTNDLILFMGRVIEL